MRIIYLVINLTLIFLALYLTANIVRYIFFKATGGGGFFGLSDKWIKNNQDKKEK